MEFEKVKLIENNGSIMVTIPKDFANKMGFKPGEDAIWIFDSGKLSIVKADDVKIKV